MIIHSPIGNICKRPVIIAFAAALMHVAPLIAQNSTQHKNGQKIQQLCASNPLGGATVAVSVRGLASGNKVVAANERVLMRPASIQKLFATALALDSLGGGYRFETQILRRGSITDSTLDGSLVLAGGGDPSLGSRFMDSTRPETQFAGILAQVKAAGIRKVAGGISVRPWPAAEHPVPDTWVWQDIANYYGAGPSGFCFMDNMFQLNVKTGSAGSTVQITGTQPEMPDLNFTSYATAQPISTDESNIYGAPFSSERELRGQLPLNRSMQIKASMPQPALVFARELRKFLTSNGIEVLGEPMVDTLLGPAERIGTVYSPALRQLVAVTNKNSHNLFAEQCMLAISRSGDYAQRLAEMQKRLAAKVPDAASSHFYDACGLSPFDLSTADVFAQFLVSVSKASYFADFEASLPVAGCDGTLKSWCRSNGLARLVVAKTGTMTSTRSLAGYMTASNGSRYAFCIMVNNYTGSPADAKALIEQILAMIFDNK